MQHETATIKKVVKKYKTKDGVKKESISYNAKLTTNSGFNDGDKVAVVLLKSFNELDNISIDEIQQLKNDVANKDELLVANNESIAKYKLELQKQLDIISAKSKQNKIDEKTIDDLKSDISAKDKTIEILNDKINAADVSKSKFEKIIADNEITINDLKNQIQNLEKTIADNNSIINEYSKKFTELNDTLTTSKEVILSKNNYIYDLEKEIAVLNAVDISELKEKVKELDNIKDELITISDKLNSKSNVISLLQNQIMEYIQLVNYYKEKALVSENKGFFDYLLKKDVTANIVAPKLYLIDLSGNIKDSDTEIVDINAENNDNSDNNDNVDDETNMKDEIILI